MDFELSDEQRMFRDTLRAFVDKEIVPVASEWERSGRYPTEIVDTMKDLGLFGITVPEEYGGLGIDMVSFALVFEEEVVMLGGIGVEIGLGPIHSELAQKAGFRELVQGVVDGRQRDRNTGARRLVEQNFGGDVPIALAKQQPSEGDALPRRTQAHAAQLVPQFGQGRSQCRTRSTSREVAIWTGRSLEFHF